MRPPHHRDGGRRLRRAAKRQSPVPDRWLEHIGSQVSPRTHERYAEIARKNVAPLLGRRRSDEAAAEQITAAYAKALAERADATARAASRPAPSTTCTAFCVRPSTRPCAGS